MDKFLKIAKTVLPIVISLLFTGFILIIKVIFLAMTDNSESQESESNSFYVIDEKGNEVIDDHVAYVFDLDNQRDYKGPL